MYIVTVVYGHCLSCVSCVSSCLLYVVHCSLVVAISCLYLRYIAHDVLLMFAVCCSVLAICC